MIKGKYYPVKFGFNAYMQLESILGITVQKLDLNSLTHLINLAYVGLKEGARYEKKEFDLTIFDLGDLLDESPELLSQIVSAFNKSQTKASEEGNVKAARAKKK